MHHLSYETGTTIIPSLYVRKLGHGEVTCSRAHSYLSEKGQFQNVGSQAPESLLSTPSPYHFSLQMAA